MSRRGFTLIELLVGLVVLSIFAATVVGVITMSGRAAAHATESLRTDRTLRTVQTFLATELGDAASSDIAVMAPARIALPRPIGDALVCAAGSGALIVADAAWTGTRAPEAGRDEAWLLVDAVAGAWQASAILAVGRDRCPLDDAPATRLTLAADPGPVALLRVLEPVELSAYRSGPADWFGLTAASHASPVQPFAGPLVPSAVRISLRADHLDVALQPDGAQATIVQFPLASAP